MWNGLDDSMDERMRWVGVWELLGIMGERLHTECLDVAAGKQLRWDLVLKRLA